MSEVTSKTFILDQPPAEWHQMTPVSSSGVQESPQPKVQVQSNKVLE